MKIIKESLCPEIGPFYVIDGAVFNDTEPVKDMTSQLTVLDSDTTHYDYWKTLQRIYPEFRSIDYDYFPRGRVVYDRKKDQYNLFIDKCITSKEIAEIVSEINLPRNKTVTDYDEHYQCHTCNSNYVNISENYEV